MSIDLKNKRFLVVEDQPQPMNLLTTLLKDLGALEVFTASDGEAALTFLRSNDNIVDIIICDWNMPRCSGIDVLKFVRRARPGVPFIMITANVDMGSVKLARENGVNAYITKPFKLDEVEGTLADIVNQL